LLLHGGGSGNQEASMVALAYASLPQSFSDRVFNLLQKADYRLAVTDEERDAIFRLRYEAYLKEGAIVSNFSRSFSDKFDDTDNCWLFGVHVDGVLAASLRLHVCTASHPEMPAVPVFPDILEPEIAAGKVIVDPTRFVVDQNMARRYPELPYITTRIGWLAGEYFGADSILATVRTEHQAFYKRVFGHQLVADARDYPTLVKPLSLMVLDFATMREKVHQRYPFFRSSLFERRMLFDPSAALRVTLAADTVGAGVSQAMPTPSRFRSTAKA
jgi:N-acyl-L-homoserine lactone synthetase